MMFHEIFSLAGKIAFQEIFIYCVVEQARVSTYGVP